MLKTKHSVRTSAYQGTVHNRRLESEAEHAQRQQSTQRINRRNCHAEDSDESDIMDIPFPSATAPTGRPQMFEITESILTVPTGVPQMFENQVVQDIDNVVVRKVSVQGLHCIFGPLTNVTLRLCNKHIKHSTNALLIY
jgi:hypothetical protein